MNYLELLKFINEIACCKGKTERDKYDKFINEIACCKGKTERDKYDKFINEIACSNGHKPLVMYPKNSAYIMLISESPSVPASINRALNNSNNPSFRESILPLIFNNCKENDQVLEDEFNNKFYWTHFCKCCPGNTDEKGNLNQICANAYLKKEIELFYPKLIITIGRYASKYLFGLGRRKSMEPLVNRINQYNLNNSDKVDTVCLTHFSTENRKETKIRLQLEQTEQLLRRKLKTLGVQYVIE